MTPTGAERRGSVDTKDAIRVAAARLFADRGFAETSVRDIAAAAAADPALVVRYFGSKERLFLATMTVGGVWQSLTSGPVDELGPAIVQRLLSGEERNRKIYRALLRAADRPDVLAYTTRANAAHIVEPLAARLTGDDAHLRAALVSAQIAGLLHLLWIVEDPILLATPRSTLVAVYGRALQVLIDGG